MISRSDVEAARRRVGSRVRTTPVLQADGLWLKLEQFQHTGSFKARGAFNRVLSAAERGGLPPAGAITASGGSWNASIVAEVASWGDTKLEAAGLGAFIARATEAGDYPRVVLGIVVMAVFVVLVNRLLWRRLYTIAERRTRLD